MLVTDVPEFVAAPLRIYVAGPWSDPDPVVRAANADAARADGLRILGVGHYPFVPHCAGLVQASLNPDDDEYEKHVKGFDFAFIRICDATYLRPAWERSRGSCMERQEAYRLGQWLFTSIDDIPPLKLNPTHAHLLERRDWFSAQCRQRLILGNVKYGDDWTTKDNLAEAIPELVDAENYPFMDALRIERMAVLRNGGTWPGTQPSTDAPQG